MTGTIDSITLIAIVVLLVLVFWLRNVLGRGSSDDEARIKARNEERQRAAAAAQTSEKVITLPRRGRDPQPAAEVTEQPVETSIAETEARIKAFAGKDDAVQRGLMDILKMDPAFDPEHFLTGARQAYEMIVTAFAEGNRKILKDLLGRDVFDEFSAAITERERRGEQIDQSFVGIKKADILEAELEKGVAQITVRFVSQLIKATRDKAGGISDGDPGKVTELTDIFTFSRDVSTVKAREKPNWRLIGTTSQN